MVARQVAKSPIISMFTVTALFLSPPIKNKQTLK